MGRNVTASSTNSEPLVIEARDITVEYQTPAMRTSTLKEAVINRLRGKNRWLTAHALTGLSVDVKKGECIGLIGHNGCGKSTFLKVLAGILKPMSGTLTVRGRVAPLIELGAGFDSELTGRENVYLSCSLMGLKRSEIDERLESIRAFAELGEFFEAPVKTYSSGMYMRLGFACTTAIDADLLLIDEVLAVGDENFQRKCQIKMKATRDFGATIVLVSHDLGVVSRMADRVLVIHRGKLAYQGPSNLAIDYYHEILNRELSAKLSPPAREEEMRRQRLAMADARDNTALKEHGDAQILRARVQGPGGSEALETGKPWSLFLDVDVRRPFRQPPTVGYAIHSISGLRLFGGNSKLHKALAQNFGRDVSQAGPHTVEFNFDSLVLATGEYYIIAAIHDFKIEMTIDIRPDIARFTVVDGADPSNFDRDVLAPAWRQATVRLASAKV